MFIMTQIFTGIWKLNLIKLVLFPIILGKLWKRFAPILSGFVRSLIHSKLRVFCKHHKIHIWIYKISFGCLEFKGIRDGYFLWKTCYTKKNRKMTFIAVLFHVYWYQFCSISLLLHNCIIKVIFLIKCFKLA